MLTFTPLAGSSIRIVGGQLPIVSFPAEVVAGAINLLPSPQEHPSRETISWPGEYDVAGITIRGVGHAEGQKVSYVVEVDSVRIAFPATPLDVWEESDIEHLGEVHVLVLPTDDAKICQKLLDDVDPRVLIIVPGADGNLNVDVLKACGAIDKERVSEYKLKGALPQDGREVVVFA